jgi:hypothetical protein
VTVQQSPLIQFAVSYSPVVLFRSISVLYSLDSNNYRRWEIHIVHTHPVYLICPDLFSAVSETSCGIWQWFIQSHIIFTICLCIWGVKSNLIQLSKQKSYSQNRKENCRCPPEIITFVFGDHTLYHLTHTAPLLDC